MATKSTMLALGTPAPPFALPEPVTGATVSLGDLTGAALVVTFVCNHCPYVKHVAAGLAELGRDMAARAVPMVGISSNDVTTYPQDGPEQMAQEANRHGLERPLPLRPDPRGRPRLLRCLHTRHVRLRRRAAAGLPRATRRLPPPQRPTGHLRGRPRRGGRRARRPASRPRSAPVYRVRHQLAVSGGRPLIWSHLSRRPLCTVEAASNSQQRDDARPHPSMNFAGAATATHPGEPAPTPPVLRRGQRPPLIIQSKHNRGRSHSGRPMPGTSTPGRSDLRLDH